MSLDATVPHTGFYFEAACNLSDFATLTARTVDLSTIPNASEAPKNIPIYDMAALAGHLDTPSTRKTLMSEWAGILQRGAGVFVLKQACTDHVAIDAATAAYMGSIPAECRMTP